MPNNSSGKTGSQKRTKNSSNRPPKRILSNENQQVPELSSSNEETSSDNESLMEFESAVQDNVLLNISKSQLKDIIKRINSQIDAVEKSKAGQEIKRKHKEALNLVIDELSNLPDHNQTTNQTKNDLNILIKEVSNLKRIVLNKDKQKNIARNHQRTCIIEAGKLSFADAVKSIEQANLNEDKIRINSMFTTKAGKIVIKCKDNIDQEKLIKNCEAANVPLRKMKLKQTKLIVNGLSSELNNLITSNDKGELEFDSLKSVLTMRHQNSDELKKGIDINKVFKSKNDKMSVIFYADEQTVELIKRDPFFYVGIRSHKIQPYIDLRQCFNCNHLEDHIAINCKSGPKCGKCGDNHKTNDCNSDTKKCLLCLSSSEYANNAHTHGARDSNCPVKQQFTKNKIEQIWI